jgi:molybdopterin/thiamine biosynthesis adenylyltransferase
MVLRWGSSCAPAGASAILTVQLLTPGFRVAACHDTVSWQISRRKGVSGPAPHVVARVNKISDVKVLLVGLGGLGCPTALALMQSGVGVLRIIDDDLIEASNLHRQILFSSHDVGQDKLSVGIEALRRFCPESRTRLEPIHSRLLPDNARSQVREADIVVEGSDNFATKFLTADACHIERKPCVQGAALRWVTTAFSSSGMGVPCYRCLFEDLPSPHQAPNCAEAGVVGPVVGFGAALMVELTLSIINGVPDYEYIRSYDGRRDELLRQRVFAREDCQLCGKDPQITDTEWSRYLGADCFDAAVAAT